MTSTFINRILLNKIFLFFTFFLLFKIPVINYFSFVILIFFLLLLISVEELKKSIQVKDLIIIIFVAFFAFINRPLINSKGENTSALFGFANFLIDIRDKHQPDYLAVVFDAGNSHREDIYPAYKATREKMPAELRASRGIEKVNFGVSLKNGKVSVVARRKK